MAVYDKKSLCADEFINHDEILDTLEYADAHKDDVELCYDILKKCRPHLNPAHEHGALITHQKGKTLTEEEMRAVLSYTRRVSENAVEEIREGYIAPSPTEEACAYCDMGAICHFAQAFPRKTGGSFDAALIEALIASEEEKC